MYVGEALMVLVLTGVIPCPASVTSFSGLNSSETSMPVSQPDPFEGPFHVDLPVPMVPNECSLSFTHLWLGGWRHQN